MVDSDDNVEIPIKTTAMAPPNARLASINELISIIVLTSLPLSESTAFPLTQARGLMDGRFFGPTDAPNQGAPAGVHVTTFTDTRS